MHPYIDKLRGLLDAGRCDRREFLRTATLLGVSAGTAYAMAGAKDPVPAFGRRAWAAPAPTGRLRIAMRVQDISDPHTASWVETSNQVRAVCEYLTRTGQDNITRPYLLESWVPSEDLKTWTLKLRQDVKWHDGRAFVSDDVVWNIKHCLDPATGSSVLGLMKSYMTKEVPTGETKDGKPVTKTELWDSNAIEKVDDHTVVLNLKEPQLAVPEHLFHYPFFMLDPAENGKYGLGSNGTGPFIMKEYVVGDRSAFEPNPNYWGEPAKVARLEYYDTGDDMAAAIAALASGQVDGLYEIDVSQLQMVATIPNVTVYEAITAQTGVARGHCGIKPFDDPRVRKALKLATDPHAIKTALLGERGGVGEHHHVAPIHPEYAKLPPMNRNIAEAKRLLAEADFPNGLDLEFTCRSHPVWEPNAVQVIVEQWKEAGVRAKINILPSSSYWDNWTNYPFSFTSWGHRPLGTMVLGLAYRTGVPWNESHYSNPEFDALLSKAEGTYDVEKRREIMAKLEEIMQEDGPVVQTFWRPTQSAFHDRVQGMRQHPTQYIFAEQLSIKQ